MSKQKKHRTAITEYRGVVFGTSADVTLEIIGKPKKTKVVGKDADGLVVEWIYEDAIITMAYTSYHDPDVGKVGLYAVYKIEGLS